MPHSANKKRAAPEVSSKSRKKPKLEHGRIQKKEKAYQKATIPVPNIDGNSEISDEDVEFFHQNGFSGQFLQNLDEQAISRSKKETNRLFALQKVPYKQSAPKPPPSASPLDDSSSDWSSGVDDIELDSNDSEDDGEASQDDEDSSVDSSDEEQSYERQPRGRSTENEKEKRKTIPRLPIKLPGGQIQQTGVREGSVVSSGEEEEEEPLRPIESSTKRNFTGARFGRASVADVVSIRSGRERGQAAREQIAGICQDILSEPENSLGLLRRLLAFASPTVEATTEAGIVKVENDESIRKLAIISLMAVFKDIAPGYRIRKLTDKERGEKVSQMVGQTRDWEQGLVSCYQSYLQLADKEVRAKSGLKDICLRCMCSLLQHLTHFNFRTNIMSTLIAQLSRKSWDVTSDLCMETLISVFKSDLTGAPSLEVVRLLNRMIKERHFNVNPRLKDELKNVRASKEHVDKKQSESKAKLKRSKGKKVDTPHLSKKAKKALKENKEIRAEMEEAEAEIDREERATQQTETLKLLFVLYFSILKGSKTTPLLSAALQGIARFAHMINVDFFRDLLQVIRDIMSRLDDTQETREDGETALDTCNDLKLQLLCVLTAYDLLTGQGEALNLDLSQFTTHLYRLIPRLAFPLSQEESQMFEKGSKMDPSSSIADLLFRVLGIILTPRYGKAPSYLLAAFSKRLLTLATQTGPAMTIRLLNFVKSLLGADSKLDALLSTEERVSDGVYRDTVDDPQLCNPFAAVWWEILILEEKHYDEQVRKAAYQLRTWRPT
ncbi:SubName: Full=Related to NOC3 protein, required for maturation and intranuclear transport of pre-ribosomes {ECO:0000313/EMBL:CCA77808.1} [Serendipita indica DSM 11827]|nr:SubName: Full=Related to NOC3 protein, required for maturation and intranuclear transport of pre-ribosomes {ECO:0000313/EMBL:CCA77808.1} [Serendipita indica DSM 11827]